MLLVRPALISIICDAFVLLVLAHRDTQRSGIQDFFYVAGILRLSTKYFISRLRQQAIQHLFATWPYTLQGHDRFIERAIGAPLLHDLTYPYVHPLHVLNLARETHVDIIVPAAVYFLSLYTLEEILRNDHPKLLVEHPSRPSNQLSPNDLQAYTLMYQYRLRATQEFIRHGCTKRPTSAACVGQQGMCAKGFAHLGSRLDRSWVLRTGPLHYMVQVINEAAGDRKICAPCREAFKRDTIATRARIWTELPGVIGLPSWEEMEKMNIAS